MNIHFVGINEPHVLHLAIALHQKGYQIVVSDFELDNSTKALLQKNNLLPTVLGWNVEKINSSINAVIVASYINDQNLEVQQAKALGVKVYSFTEFLFEQSKNKTRVVIAGSNNKTMIAAMVLHVLQYHDKQTDYAFGFEQDGNCKVHLTSENDFILLELTHESNYSTNAALEFNFYKPNIALISQIDNQLTAVYKQFVTSVTNGGIMVYNEENELVKELIETSEHVVKKYPYQTPAFYKENDSVFLQTDEGDLPLETNTENDLQNLAGAKWICQHMGIDQDDFYEAIASFEF